VYLRGEQPSHKEWFYYNQKVVVQLNGKYFVCDYYPYILDPIKKQTLQTRAKVYQRRTELANNAVGQYVAALEGSSQLRAYAEELSAALSTQIRVPL
jgi:hypothetical protein